jgi:hypothetical protein
MADKGKGVSTAQRKIEAAAKVKAWGEAKVREGNLHHYVHHGKLNKSELAREIGVARSTLVETNKLARAEIERIEREFVHPDRSPGSSKDEPEKRSESNALERKLASTEREVNRLRQRLAVLIAENEELKKKLASSNSILDDIIPSGRRVQL